MKLVPKALYLLTSLQISANYMNGKFSAHHLFTTVQGFQISVRSDMQTYSASSFVDQSEYTAA